jgi:hypothetical protein
MKKIYLILSVFAIVFSACETDFDVNADWEETTVVFGLLDAAKDTQFIKISKAFLGEDDALQMAQYSDSINFNKGELDVKITRINNNGSTDTIMLNEIRALRDEGDFNDSIVMYTFENFEFESNSLNQYTNFLNANSEYELLIKNNITGNSVRSTTDIIGSFDFSPTPSKFVFYNSTYGLDAYQDLDWIASITPKAVAYQIGVRFHYKEDNVIKVLFWNQIEVDKYESSLTLYGRDFISFLEGKLSKDNSTREFLSIDIVMTLGSQDLKTYMDVNSPITGIVQERPQFTNIHNGIGLFSSRYTREYVNLPLSIESISYLINNSGLNFQ